MAFAALSSYLMLRYRGPKRIEVQASPSRLRIFKHEHALVSLRILSKNARWFTFSSASVPHSSGFTLRREHGRVPGDFIVVADHAGRYEGIEFSVSLGDVLGLFTRVEAARPPDLVVEVLPLSILSLPSRSMIYAVATGETPAGVRGSGQEFYGIEEYAGMGDSKDILWRRVAQASEESIVTRVREANVPQSLKVCLIESKGGDRVLWMDTVTEALGRIGVTLLGVGVGLEVLVSATGGEVSVGAKNMDELADLVMGVWEQAGVPEHATDAALNADLIITGSGNLARREIFALSDSKPTLVVLDTETLPALGARSQILSETFEFENILSWVAVR
jgi:hypothetical protein